MKGSVPARIVAMGFVFHRMDCPVWGDPDITPRRFYIRIVLGRPGDARELDIGEIERTWPTKAFRQCFTLETSYTGVASLIWVIWPRTEKGARRVNFWVERLRQLSQLT